MGRRETLAYYVLRKMGLEKLAEDIVSGKVRHTGADLPPKVEVPDPVKVEPSEIAPAKRKRRRSVVKEEPYDSDFVERPPEPKRKKRKKAKPAPKPKPKPKAPKRKASKRRKPTPKRKRT